MTRLVATFHTYAASLLRDERGANLLEYSLLVAFIAIAVIFAVTQVGEKTLSNMDSVLPIEPRTP